MTRFYLVFDAVIYEKVLKIDVNPVITCHGRSFHKTKSVIFFERQGIHETYVFWSSTTKEIIIYRVAFSL